MTNLFLLVWPTEGHILPKLLQTKKIYWGKSRVVSNLKNPPIYSYACRACRNSGNIAEKLAYRYPTIQFSKQFPFCQESDWQKFDVFLILNKVLAKFRNFYRLAAINKKFPYFQRVWKFYLIFSIQSRVPATHLIPTLSPAWLWISVRIWYWSSFLAPWNGLTRRQSAAY